jgi:trans-aconitate 2-methyltransferase
MIETVRSADDQPANVSFQVGDAGLDVTRRSVVDREWDFGSRDEFAQWCAVGFLDWTSRLPSGERDAFVDAVVDRYEAIVGRPGVFRFLQLRAELRPNPTGDQRSSS